MLPTQYTDLMPSGHPLISVVCRPGHDVFGPVAERLRERGFAVEFLEPGVEVPRERIEAADLLVNKKIRWESLDALEYAHRIGVPAWNDYVATSLFVNRLSQVAALRAVGFDVPEITDDPPEGEYVAKGFFDVQEAPTLNGEGDFYQPRLEFDGVDEKYYAVDDGTTVHAAVVRFESKLLGERRHLGRGEVDPAVARRIERLLDFAGASALGVDVVSVDGRTYAVDVNPATSFRRTGLTDVVVDSIAASVPD